MPGLGPTEDYFGPYYRQQKRAVEVQGRAVGRPEMAPASRAAEEYGMLSAWGDRKAVEEKFQVEKGFKEREMKMKEEEAEASKKSGMVSGMATLGGIGATIGTAAGPALGLGTIVASGATAGSVVPGLGTAIGAILGLAGGLVMSKKVICTELHRQGLLPFEVYLADSLYGNRLPEDVLIGYHLWAVPVTNAMKQSRMLTKVVSWIAIPWAYEMAHRVSPYIKGSILGKMINILGLPICKLIGKIVIKRSILLAFKGYF